MPEISKFQPQNICKVAFLPLNLMYLIHINDDSLITFKNAIH